MKSKTLSKYIYIGFGFPIELRDVKLVYIVDEWVPVLDVRELSHLAISELSFQARRLTGNQVKFIRDYFEMSLRDFASKVVHQSHMAVSKWEKFSDQSTNMDAATEVVLRLYICHEILRSKPKSELRFIEAYEKISSMDFKRSAA